MRWIAFVVLVLTLVTPATLRASDTPESRLRDLIERGADGSLGDIVSEVTPGAFESRPMVEQVIVYTGTSALAALVGVGDTCPLKKIVPAATWPKLLAARTTLEQVAAAMRRTVHETALRGLAGRDIAAARLLVGMANLYLRQMGEAETPAEAAIDLFIAAGAASIVGEADLQAAMLKLSTDPQATPEVRERAGWLYSLNAETSARAKVAVLQWTEALGGGAR